MSFYRLLFPHLKFWQIAASLFAALFTIGGSLWAAHHWNELQSQVRDLSATLKAAPEPSKKPDTKNEASQISVPLQPTLPATAAAQPAIIEPAPSHIEEPSTPQVGDSIPLRFSNSPPTLDRPYDKRWRTQLVEYQTNEAPGTIIIDTANIYLYLVLGNGIAKRYPIRMDRSGVGWSGVERVTKMAHWPDWRPTKEMKLWQPSLPDFIEGGRENPLGARALYVGNTPYRIHGMAEPETLGRRGSTGGSVGLVSIDIIDLYSRVQIGTRIVTLQ